MNITLIDALLHKKAANKKQIAVLIDPDKANESSLEILNKLSITSGIDYFFVGGSLLTADNTKKTVAFLKENSSIPVVLFPGSVTQIEPTADAILFLSLISGRNPEFLIGAHVIAAPMIKASGLEAIPTGYMIIESGRPTTVSYISNSFPIPHHKPDIAACTAMAGELLGLKLIYLDAGSGAEMPVSNDMIAAVRKSVSIPIIVGGGIRSSEGIRAAFEAGADVVVIGNILEEKPELIAEFAYATQ